MRKNTPFLPPTDAKNDSLTHHNTQESTLTNDSAFQILNHKYEPGVCAIVDNKYTSLKTKQNQTKQMKPMFKQKITKRLMTNHKRMILNILM